MSSIFHTAPLIYAETSLVLYFGEKINKVSDKLLGQLLVLHQNCGWSKKFMIKLRAKSNYFFWRGYHKASLWGQVGINIKFWNLGQALNCTVPVEIKNFIMFFIIQYVILKKFNFEGMMRINFPRKLRTKSRMIFWHGVTGGKVGQS